MRSTVPRLLSVMFGSRKRAERAEAREALRAEVESRGWTWREAAPPPPIEVREAALREIRRPSPIWTIGMAETATGIVDGAPFTAGRLVGYAYRTSNSGTAFGDRETANAVWLALPGALPEIRLVDTTGPDDDHGLPLPPLPAPTAFAPRWRAEGFIPAFAADLLTPQIAAALHGAPSCSAVVIRAGIAIVYGMPTWDVATIEAALRFLQAFAGAVPAQCWGRADALTAGTGVFPYDLPAGALRLEQRLVAPNWKGFGLAAKVGWEQAVEAPRSVVLTRGQVGDVWDLPPRSGATSSVSVGLRIGGAQLGPDSNHGIATVASTLASRTGGIPPTP